jgi:hypothetical protein
MEEISGKCRVLCWQKPQGQFFLNAVSVKTLILGHFSSFKKIWAGNYVSE